MLHKHIADCLDRRLAGGKDWVRRPRIAVIDTGYAKSSAFFRRHQNQVRFRIEDHGKSSPQYHYKDFWESKKDEPCDDDGHGTEMLSMIMKVAPFADLCVARIASTSEDLRQSAGIVSRNLANVLPDPARIHVRS